MCNFQSLDPILQTSKTRFYQDSQMRQKFYLDTKTHKSLHLISWSKVCHGRKCLKDSPTWKIVFVWLSRLKDQSWWEFCSIPQRSKSLKSLKRSFSSTHLSIGHCFLTIKTFEIQMSWSLPNKQGLKMQMFDGMQSKQYCSKRLCL